MYGVRDRVCEEGKGIGGKRGSLGSLVCFVCCQDVDSLCDGMLMSSSVLAIRMEYVVGIGLFEVDHLSLVGYVARFSCG